MEFKMLSTEKDLEELGPIFIDSHHPFVWRHDWMTVSDLRLAIHAGYHTTLRILEKEGIFVHRRPFGTRQRHYVDRSDARLVINMHGSEAARARRMAQAAARKKGVPLWMPCPHCGKKGRQWRSGRNTAGNREARCGHCNRSYTIRFGARPPLASTCVHCGETTHQWRMQLTSLGNLTIRCGHCRRHYTMKGNPDPVVVKPRVQGVIPRPYRIEW